MAEHTPTPWQTNIARRSDNQIIVAHVVTSDGTSIAQIAGHPNELNNAEFIVRAVNAHGDLVAALKPFASLADEIEQCCSEYAENAPERDPENWVKACSWEDLVRARAEVAKAAQS